ncbi:MAG TPA: hypothetical protein DEA30_01635 [Acholeplasmataceae bacterium]|nr:hypothetical protein [Acholeplasmataceae bacterium]HBO68262.1 hypothetical protein [Acholeplasmataceae bacterium]HBS00563.1 hypothetical protein [Acholeplasmataceae bacterium]HCB20077.1 hypothetical protein [Acholeplasmataceae bacterium]
MFDQLIAFLTSVPLWELIMIFSAKIIEVTIGTMRVILITKGYRKPGTVLAIFEILLWVFIASRVIMGIVDYPLKGLVYSLGFAFGVYIGSLLETRLAVGKILIYVIVDYASGKTMAEALRAAGNGVTTLDAHGKDSDRMVLMIFANRKNKATIIEVVEALNEKALIVSNEVSILQGGYVSPWRRIAK